MNSQQQKRKTRLVRTHLVHRQLAVFWLSPHMVEGTGSPLRPLYRARISLMTDLPPKALPSNCITFRIRISTCKFERGGVRGVGWVGQTLGP